MKKRDDAKIAKGREQLEDAKRTYEILNSELHDELPALFDSRILFLVTNLQTLFNAEHTFHDESSKVKLNWSVRFERFVFIYRKFHNCMYNTSRVFWKSECVAG